MTDKPCDDGQPNYYEEACRWVGQQFSTIAEARERSRNQCNQLAECVNGLDFGTSLSFVAFGSLARGEATAKSDIDWTLLANGPTELEHYQIALEIRKRLETAKLIEPGASGLFGGLASSHDMIHKVGGDEDTNANMTRRLLLLLESQEIAGAESRQHVIANLLSRYVAFGREVDPPQPGNLKIPRFLLNDFVRYWRTVAVDYASKLWLQDTKKWAIRNTKLRFSRKLMFLKGMLICLDCELSPDVWPWQNLDPSDYEGYADIRLQKGLTELIELSPIENLCRVGMAMEAKEATAEALEAYDYFLHLLDDEEKRSIIEKLDFVSSTSDPLFKEVRRGSRRFGDALQKLLFQSNDRLTALTMEYGVF